MRGNDKLVIPGPVLWRHRPIEFSNLDYSRTDWECGKVVADVLCENRGYHMWDICGEYVPAQRAEGEAAREMSERGRARAGTHAVRPIPLPSSMARGRRFLAANFAWVSARYMARHWPPSQRAVPFETPSASWWRLNVEALNGQRRMGMCFVRWAGWDDVMFKWGLFGSQDVARANLRAASWCPRATSSSAPNLPCLLPAAPEPSPSSRTWRPGSTPARTRWS